MQIFARPELATNVPFDDRPRLLLEGSWPVPKARGRGAKDLALDDLIDGRDAAIDVEAERLAERIASVVQRPEAGRPSFADVNVLRLRYAAVKWLRPLAWRRSLTADARPEHYELHVSSAADDAEYIAMFQAIAAVDNCELTVVGSPAVVAATSGVSSLRNSRWRRWLSQWQNGDAMQTATPAETRTRVLLCGNPRLLDPVCRELVRRNIPAAWLYDRYPIRSGLRWAWRGVPTFTCDETSSAAVISLPQLGESIRYDRIDLTETVRTWIDRNFADVGSAQARQMRRTGEHFAAFRPTHVVVDEDATPLKRIVVAAARDQAICSAVVQHGACAIRFGFVPLSANSFLAADAGSQKQMTAWGVEPHRVVVTGSPSRAQFTADVAAARIASSSPRKRIVLLGTTPPRDRRPDAVEFRFTPRTYEQVLAVACQAIAELPNAELIIRPHPRTAMDAALRTVRKRFPTLRSSIASARSSLAKLVASADCVLSCASSSGIESAAAGVPVVQLLPEGSGNILPAEWYGLLGSARSLDELKPLLQTALSRDPAPTPILPPPDQVAARVVETILFPAETKPAPHLSLKKATEAPHA
jgi:hypothetical protein